MDRRWLIASLAAGATVALALTCVGLVPPRAPRTAPWADVDGAESSPDTAIRGRAALPDGLVTVSVLLPDAQGGLGGGAWRQLVDGDPLGDERLALGLAHPSQDVPPLDHRDAVRAAYRAAGVRPADHAEWLARTSPDLAYDFLLQAGEWRRRDALRGVDYPTLASRFDDERALASALVAHTPPDSVEARAARFALLQAEVATLPTRDRPAHVWRGLLAMIEATEGNNFAWSIARRTLSELPSVRPADHEVLADMAERRGGLIAAQISDLALRAALRDGDVERIGYWWPRLHRARSLPTGVSPTQLGAATRWDDGLRQAAVVCSRHAHPLDVLLVADPDGWASSAQPDDYLTCILSGASPLPPVGQRAQLVVRPLR